MKILTGTFYALFVLLLLSVAGLFLASMLPIPGNIEIKIVKSGSMEPSIPVGAIVIVQPKDSYAVNDVITFGADTRNEIPTTHRIISMRTQGNETMFTTKGDANEESDQNEVASSNVIGKVLTLIPYAGYVLDFARQPLGFVLLIAVPAGIIILDELIRIIREVRDMRRRRYVENV